MERYQLILDGDSHFQLILPGTDSNGGNLIISGLIMPVFLGGTTTMLIKTVQSALSASISLATSPMDIKLLTEACDMVSSIALDAPTSNVVFTDNFEEILEVTVSAAEQVVQISSDQVEAILVRPTYVATWSGFPMEHMKNMTMQSMMYTEV